MKANKFETYLWAIFMHKIIRLSSLLTMEPDRGYYGYGYDYLIISIQKIIVCHAKNLFKKARPRLAFFYSKDQLINI